MPSGKKGSWIALLLALALLLSVTGYKIALHLQATSHSQAAQRALERRAFSEASLHLKKCRETWPNDPALCLLAAQTARRGGDLYEATQLLELCEQKNGPQEAVALERRLLHLQRGELDEADLLLAACLEHPEAAATPLILEALLEGNLKQVSTDFARGVSLERGTGANEVARVRRAVDLWLQLRTDQADQVQGLVWRGLIHLLAKEYESARSDLHKAVERDPGHFQARFQLAVAVLDEAPAAAAAHLEILRERNPEDKRVRALLASTRRTLGQLEEARAILDELLAANPEDVSLLEERGKVALDAGRFEESEQWLRQALDRDPDNAEINLAMSQCLRLAGRPNEAKPYQARFDQAKAKLEQEQKRLPPSEKGAP